MDHSPYLDLLATPGGHSELVRENGHLKDANGGRTFPIRDGILYLLPEHIANAHVKEGEKEGWKRILTRHDWRFDGQHILTLPEIPGDAYWSKAARAFGFAMALVKQANARVGLDLACGTGWATARFVRAGIRMIAADFNDTEHNGLAAAIRTRAHGIEMEAVCCDGEELPIKDGALDFVFVSSAVHHFTQPEKALQEIRRVLRPGGMFIAICESFATGWGDKQREEKLEKHMEFREAGINEQTYTQRQYERMFAAAGFKLQTIIPCMDRVIEGRPPEEWINAAASPGNNAFKRVIVRGLLALFPRDLVLRVLRWRMLHLTVNDRILIGRN